MKIIDSNKDYYDFYQNIYRDDTLTFDRRDSYNLSKEEFAHYFYYDNFPNHFGERYNKSKDILLQICNTFWLFELVVIKTDNFGKCIDYNLNLQSSWKDYNYKSELIKLSHIHFVEHWNLKYDLEKKLQAIKIKDYKEVKVFNKFILCKSNGIKDDREERHIPILQNIGIASLVEPLDIYLAIEEYLGKQKTADERTESVGLSNNEKVTNHGFDLKSSFRGK